MKNTLSKVDLFWSSFTFISMLILLILLAAQYFIGTVKNENLYLAYFVFGLLSVLLAAICWVVSVAMRKGGGVAAAFYLADEDDTRLLSRTPLRVATIILLILFVIGLTTLAGSLIPVPNFLGTGPLTTEALTTSPTPAANLFNMTFYPAFFEEMPLFFLANLLRTLFLLGAVAAFRKKRLWSNPALNLLAILVSSLLVAALFGFGIHNLAYGADTGAKLTAFGYAFVAQSANQLTGAFISWIPHAFHNATVLFTLQFSFSIGGSLLLMAAANRWLRGEPHER